MSDRLKRQHLEDFEYIVGLTDDAYEAASDALDGVLDLIGTARESDSEGRWSAYQDAINYLGEVDKMLGRLEGAIEEEQQWA